MSTPNDLDLTTLRRTWNARREALRAILRRIDPRGMTRPAREPEERAWLEERGQAGAFIEDDQYAEAARLYYRRKYVRDESTTGKSSQVAAGGDDPIAAAANFGIDISLLRSSLQRTPGERLRELDANMSFVAEVRKNAGLRSQAEKS